MMALLLVGASLVLAYMAFKQVPCFTVSLLMLAGAALVLGLAGWFVWRACSGQPALVIGKQGIWHHLALLHPIKYVATSPGPACIELLNPSGIDR